MYVVPAGDAVFVPLRNTAYEAAPATAFQDRDAVASVTPVTVTPAGAGSRSPPPGAPPSRPQNTPV
ncbi:hypothetical protein EES39_02990 [Streptomyces sp. ADI92-24]|nr:hypothetical protein EES39_02990 [Streptomyces sp. ADI92-24]